MAAAKIGKGPGTDAGGVYRSTRRLLIRYSNNASWVEKAVVFVKVVPNKPGAKVMPGGLSTFGLDGNVCVLAND